MAMTAIFNKLNQHSDEILGRFGIRNFMLFGSAARADMSRKI